MPFRYPALVLALTICAVAVAQTGVRVVLYDFEFAMAEGQGRSLAGLGVDHDFSERNSMGFDLRYDLANSGYCAQLRSAYHFSDNRDASVYMGPVVGYQRIGDVDKVTVVPLGMRLGLRGGLERFYADLYVGVVANMSSADVVTTRGEDGYQFSSTVFVAGLNIGFGWVD